MTPRANSRNAPVTTKNAACLLVEVAHRSKSEYGNISIFRIFSVEDYLKVLAYPAAASNEKILSTDYIKFFEPGTGSMWSRPEDYNSEQMITSTLFYGNGLRQLIRDITPHSLFCYHKKGFEAYARKNLVDLSEECFWHQPEEPKYCNWSDFGNENQKKNSGLEGWVTCNRLDSTNSNDDILAQAQSPVLEEKPAVPILCDKPHRWKEPLNVTFFHFTNTDRFIEQYKSQITYRNMLAHNTKPSVAQERQQYWYRWPASAITRNKEKTLKSNMNNRRPRSKVRALQTSFRVSSSKEAAKTNKPQAPRRPSSESTINKPKLAGQQRRNTGSTTTLVATAKSTPSQLSRMPRSKNRACLSSPVKTEERRKTPTVTAPQRSERNVFNERTITPGTPNDLSMSLSSSNDDLVLTSRQASESSIDTRAGHSSAESKNKELSSRTKTAQEESKRLNKGGDRQGEHGRCKLQKRKTKKRGKRRPSKLVKDASSDSLEQFFFAEASSDSPELRTCEDSSTETHSQASTSDTELGKQTRSNLGYSTDGPFRWSPTGAYRESPCNCSTDENRTVNPVKAGPEQTQNSLTDLCRAKGTSDTCSLPPLTKLPVLLNTTDDKSVRLACSHKNISLERTHASVIFYTNKYSDDILKPRVVETRTYVSSSASPSRCHLDATASVHLRRGSTARSLSSPASINNRHQQSPKVDIKSRNESTQTPPFFNIPLKSTLSKRGFRKNELAITEHTQQLYLSNEMATCHVSEMSTEVIENLGVNDETGFFAEQCNPVRLWNEIPHFEEEETPRSTPRNEDAESDVSQAIQPAEPQLLRNDIEGTNPLYNGINDDALACWESLKETPKNHLSRKGPSVDVREFQLISHLFRQQQRRSKDTEEAMTKVTQASATSQFRKLGVVPAVSQRHEITAASKPFLGINYDIGAMRRTSAFREFRLPPPLSVVTNPAPSKFPVNVLSGKMVKHTNKFTIIRFPQVGGLTVPHLEVKPRTTKKRQKPKTRPRK